MEKIKKIITKGLLVTLTFIYFFSPNLIVQASNLDSNTLLISGGVTVTKQTTIDQIIDQYGEEPKLVTPSAMGGKSYTFYKDNYQDILYFETLSDGTIFAYGAISDDFQSNKYSYGEKVDGTYSYLSGYALTDYDNAAMGFISYRSELITTSVYNNYINEFLSDQSEYEKYVAKHATLMSNYFYYEDGVTVQFDDDIYDTLKKMEDKENQTQNILSDYASKTSKSAYMKFVYGATSILSSFQSTLPNPITLVSYVKNYRPTEDKNILYLSYHAYENNNRLTTRLFAYYVSPKIIEKMANEVTLTEKEIELYNQVHNKYMESVDTFNQSGGEMYIEEPVFKTLPLKAGKIYSNILEGTTMYLNSIRLGAGLPELKHDEDLSDIAQHKSALVVYINNVDDTGNESGNLHTPVIPPGVDSAFYNRAMERMSGENLYNTGVISTNPINSITNALNDGNGDPIAAGHRYNLLDPNYTNFGIGVTELQAVHRFTGYQANNIEMVAWPSKGVTPMEGFSGGYWTAKFYNKYKPTDSSTVTVKRLNDNAEWNFTKQTTSGINRFKIGTDMVSFYNADMTAGDKYVYEVTVHNVKNLTTGENEDYTYRSVFMNAYSTDDEIQDLYPSSITTNISDYTGEVGDVQVIDVTFGNNPAEKLLKFSSSNSRVAKVNQYGRVELMNPGKATITIETLNGLKKTVNINVNGDINYLMGDMNNNGRIDVADIVVYVKLYFNKIESNSYYKTVGDMNYNGRYDVADLVLIVKTYFGKI